MTDRDPEIADPGATTDSPNGSADPGRTTDRPAAPDTHPRGRDETPHHSAPRPASPATGEYTPELDSVLPPGGVTTDQPPESAADRDAAPTPSYAGAPANKKKPTPIPAVPGYAIEGVLGRGGMGVVYKARQSGLNRTVALKMILAGGHATPAQLGRFRAEARAIAAVRHPNIVQIYEVGEHEGVPYFSLEFCAGGSLDAKLHQEPQPPRQAAELAEQLARAMKAAHDAGVIHRDLKPGNVLLDGAGTPKVTDFGLAREQDDDAGYTRTGSILGTPSYMAPEQALGKTKEVGPHSDQYSLGATLYDLLTGRPPFKGTSVMETLEQVRNREPVPPVQLAPNCPRDLETICLKALAKDPAKRYADCGALADDLRAFLDGRPIQARPVGAVEKAWRWAKRNPKVAGLTAAVAGLVLLLGIGGVTAAVVFDRQKQEAVELAGREKAAHELAEKKRVEAETERDLKEKARAAEAEARVSQAEFGELTRTTVSHAVNDIPDKLRQAIFARGTQQEVLALLGAMLAQQLDKAQHTHGLPDRALHTYHLQMGDLRLQQGKNAGARTHYETARGISERLMATEPKEKDKAKGNHALILRKLGALTRDAGKDIPSANAGLVLFREAEKLQRDVVDRPASGEIPPAAAKQSLAGTLTDIAETYRRMLKFADALPVVEEALKLQSEAVKESADAALAKQKLADAHVLAGKIRRGLDDEKGAEADFRAAAAIFDGLASKDTPNLLLRVAAARAAREVGDFLLMRDRLDEAAPFHVRDLDLNKSLLTTAEVLTVQNELGDAYYRSATLALKRGMRDEAAKLYKKCLDLRQAVAEARSTHLTQMKLANVRARVGDHKAAAAVSEDLLRADVNNVNTVYNVMCNIALCADAVAAGRPVEHLSPPERELRQKYVDRAFVLMTALVGPRYRYTDVVKLRTDPDLDPIRGEPRFDELLKKAAAAKGPVAGTQ
jgi:tetratricopeptide (TPR) repeat protein